ncbi:hypothetical protein BDR22DRAFT_243303 [Usnea florida]
MKLQMLFIIIGTRGKCHLHSCTFAWGTGHTQNDLSYVCKHNLFGCHGKILRCCATLSERRTFIEQRSVPLPSPKSSSTAVNLSVSTPQTPLSRKEKAMKKKEDEKKASNQRAGDKTHLFITCYCRRPLFKVTFDPHSDPKYISSKLRISHGS